MEKKPRAQSTKEEGVDHSADIMRGFVACGISGDELTSEINQITASIPQTLVAMKKEMLKQPIIVGS